MAQTQLTRSKSKRRRKEAAPCIACEPVAKLERPRFFAGQLLTEAELNSQQAYILAKNRLQNKYLHGVGVVCGLKVICHECDGYVTVESGYAIDPCGRDILVNAAHDFDLIGAIDACRQKERTRGDCQPWQTPPPKMCQDEAERWCLVIRYKEQEIRPTTPLLRSRSQCNGHATMTAASCEPTRICETYELDVIRAQDPCACGELDFNRENMYGPIVACLTRFADFLSAEEKRKRFSVTDMTQALIVAIYPTVPPDWTYETARRYHDLCQRLWCFVDKLYRDNPLDVDPTACAVFHQLQQWACQPPPDPNVDDDPQALIDYFFALQARFQGMINLIFEYLFNCVCGHLLPPCPPEETEDYLVLACLSIQEDKILRIGNWCCRRHAGSFPGRRHWFNLVPLLPLLVEQFKALCCSPDIISMFSSVVGSVDPKVAEANFNVTAAPMTAGLASRFRQARTSMTFSTADFLRWTGADALATEKKVHVGRYLNQEESVVKAAFKENEVELIVRAVADAAEIPVTAALTAPMEAAAGDQIIAFRTPDGNIAGFKRFDVAEELEAKRVELAGLRAEFDTLRGELNKLKKK